MKRLESTKPPPPKTFSLTRNDRPLTEEEEINEKKATKLEVAKYPRIRPILGTLAFLLRNIENDAVIELLRSWLKGAPNRGVGKVIIVYDSLDEKSKNRVDVFDHLCALCRIQIPVFWGAFQAASFEFHDVLTKTSIDARKQELIESIFHFARQEGREADRKLGAQVAGVMSDAPQIKIEQDNSVNINTNQQTVLGGFTNSIRDSDKNRVEEIEGREVRQLGEGKQDYIDAEEWSEEEKELISR